MKRSDLIDLADRLIRPVFRARDIEEIGVREADDTSGSPSIYVDVFTASDVLAPDVEVWMNVILTFSDELVAAGDSRFPYIWLRDRREEGQETSVGLA